MGDALGAENRLKVMVTTMKKEPNKVKILGVDLNSTEPVEVLKRLVDGVKKGQKAVVVTPNPEFLVFGQKNPWFQDLINAADLSLPDGVGLVWAARFLGLRPLLRRVAGADVAADLLKTAGQKKWRVGVIGARRGDKQQRQQLIIRLKKKYPGIKVLALEDNPDWYKESWQIVFSCQGMGDQEKWIKRYYSDAKVNIFMGVGGGLDFLTGFVQRAPKWVRRAGLEWLYRLSQQPWRWRRQLSLIKFVWLVVKEKFASLPLDKKPQTA